MCHFCSDLQRELWPLSGPLQVGVGLNLTVVGLECYSVPLLRWIAVRRHKVGKALRVNT